LSAPHRTSGLSAEDKITLREGYEVKYPGRGPGGRRIGKTGKKAKKPHYEAFSRIERSHKYGREVRRVSIFDRDGNLRREWLEDPDTGKLIEDVRNKRLIDHR
jgi:hypothetical protein